MTHALTRDDYFTGPDGERRDLAYPQDLTQQIEAMVQVLLTCINYVLMLMSADGVPLVAHPGSGSLLSSGWRPPMVNAATPGAAKTSKHMTGAAADLYDPNGKLDEWCATHLDALAAAGLWLESPKATVGWCHLQCLAPRSGNREFYP